MAGLDVSRLAPDDAMAALRSFPRRFRELLTSVDQDDLPQEAVDHADHVARAVALIGESVRQVLVQDDPTLMPAAVDDSAREWAHPGSTSIEDVLAFLKTECNALAGVVADASADAWTRTGTVAGAGQKVSALELVREAVRTGADHLRAAERAVSPR